MLSENKQVAVINNSTGKVGFKVESSRVRRRWDLPDSVKNVPLGELRDLINSAGGYQLLTEALLIKDNEVREDLGLPIIPEQSLDRKEIEEILKKTVTILNKTLENTTHGIREKIASIAIENEITNVDKMSLIKEFTGIDVYAAIQEKKEAQLNQQNKNK